MTSPTETRAIVTGASGGIGRATAIALAKAGIHVALVSRSLDKLEQTAQVARGFGVEAGVYALDLAHVDQVGDRLGQITQDFGDVDILINNAGMGYTNSLSSTSLTDWQRVIDLNLTSIFEGVKAILPGMRSRGHGTIINVISIAGRQVFPNWGAYCVSKFGLMALSKALAIEEQTHGIRVTALCPGAVNTGLWDTETVEADFDRSAMLTPEMVAQSILHVVLLPPQAVVEELTLMPNSGTF
ncbi:MAG: SDR family oxidoreductase [Oscillatoriales cyanobacterium RM2_1_1]|nr:SDR family oxidoreductase [Oscillatoriales cyanobacterium SM2_3_0]NJO45299.1 SDR family oxidoreductase [Oscillatoriales cyanobacterium RM2_1_1]